MAHVRTSWPGLASTVAIMVVLTGCSAAMPPSARETARPATSASGSARVPADGSLTGMVEVGDVSLYVECTGDGSPTILYFHGAIQDSTAMPVTFAEPIRSRVDEDYRFCAYDRRNVGRSESVDAPQSPDDMLADVEGMVEEAQITGPFVLLGASYGGLPAYLFANRNPDDVGGMVLLDAMFPDELSLEALWPEEDRYVSFDADDECCTLERISHYKTLVAASEYIGAEPDIPVIYLASQAEGLTVGGSPEFNATAPDVLQAYVDRFSPGKLVTVDAPHSMEAAIPDLIAGALREVIQLAGE
jgi:pimeloyl-ACP methyl ester carboxylesterase